MNVYNTINALILTLKLDVVLNCAEVVPDVLSAGRTGARKYTLHKGVSLAYG
jgi:hypothetical protein